MPIYWFALSQVVKPDAGRALLIFFILHILIYPSSNGFNSYMDRDEGSIGGIKTPLQPTRQLLYMSLAMDVLALCPEPVHQYIFCIGCRNLYTGFQSL